MTKKQIAQLFHRLMEKYTKLLHFNENDSFARGQYYAMMVAYAEAEKILSSNDYAKSIALGLDSEEKSKESDD